MKKRLLMIAMCAIYSTFLWAQTPVVQFKFDEASGAANIVNTGSNTNVWSALKGSGGTLTIGATDAERGQVLFVDVASTNEQWIELGNAAILGGAACTYSYWIKAADFSIQDIANQGWAPTTNFEFSIDNKKPRFGIWDGNTGSPHAYAADDLIDGQWNHVALVIPQNAMLSQVVVYVNGVASATTLEGADQAISTTSGMRFIRVLQGVSLSDFRIYDVALTAQQVTDVYTIPVEGVSVSPANPALLEGQTQQLTATVTPLSATDKSVTWSSSDVAVATVDGSGMITAGTAGTATITVTTTDGSKTATSVVAVTADIVSAMSVTLDKTSETLRLNAPTLQLTATVTPNDATDKTVTWMSSTEAVATVSQTGLVTALSLGNATITVTTNDGSHTATCDVTVAPIDVIGVTLSKTTLNLEQDATWQLTAAVDPNNATVKTIAWTSSSDAIASVVDGMITAKTEGTATITVTTTDGNKTANCVVTVTPKSSAGMLLHLALNEATGATELINSGTADDVTVTRVGDAGTVNVGAFDDERGNVLQANVDWNNESYFKFSKPGDENYAGVMGGAARTYAFWVNKATGWQDLMDHGTSIDHQLVVQFEEGTVRVAYWSATDKIIRSVDKITEEVWQHVAIVVPEGAMLHDIKIYLNGQESAIATTGDNVAIDTDERFRILRDFEGSLSDWRFYNYALTATEVLAVFEEEPVVTKIDVTGVTLDQTTATLTTDQTLQLTATVNPSDASDKTVKWSSDNDAVAMVFSTGVVTAIAPGTATITVTTNDGTFTATCSITVDQVSSSINANESASSFNVYPNPVSGNYLHVELNASSTVQKIQIFDVTGKLMFVNEVLNQTEVSVDVSTYNTGIYFVRVQNDGKIENRKVIIK